MKVMFLVRALNVGGAERQLVVLARGLQQRGHEVAVAVFYSGGVLEEELREARISVVSLGKRGRWDVFGFFFRLIKTVRAIRPDVLHSYISNLVTVVVRPFFPSVKLVWGIRSSYMDFNKYDWLYRVSYALACRASRVADLIIVNSHAGRCEHLADGYPEEKIVVIPNGIDTVRFRPDQFARAKIRSEWGVVDDHELIGLVGRLDPMKDHETFLHAAALISQVRKTARFVCVGDGKSDYRKALEERARCLGMSGTVMWVGMRSDMADVYNALDLLVNCSYGEGFSNVIGEAMACGIPCVVTDVGDSALIVGSLGGVVPPKDAVTLQGEVQRVLDSKLLPSDVRQRIINQFSVDTLISRTEQELAAVCFQVVNSQTWIKQNASEGNFRMHRGMRR